MFRHPLFALQENKMKDHHVKLTETDREILKSYSTMLEGLSMYLGEGYELVLHSLEDYSSSAVKVIHGLHTGRTEGAPLTDLALDLLEVDQYGLDKIDRRILQTLIVNFQGGPVGLETLAAAIGEDAGTLEDVYEPYLLQNGFLNRTPRGRTASSLAYEHLGFEKNS